MKLQRAQVIVEFIYFVTIVMGFIMCTFYLYDKVGTQIETYRFGVKNEKFIHQKHKSQ